MAVDTDKLREIVDSCEESVTQSILQRALTLYTILEGVKFPKGTKLVGKGGNIEVRSPGVPIYEIRLKEAL